MELNAGLDEPTNQTNNQSIKQTKPCTSLHVTSQKKQNKQTKPTNKGTKKETIKPTQQ
jgi:hypothetical protein